MFVDASAILAILLEEKHAKKRYFSALVRFEVIAKLARMKSKQEMPITKENIQAAIEIIDEFLQRYNFELTVIGEKEADLSLEAFALYGKGTGHKAGLNMGDCFAYACAKSQKIPLLFKGHDFVHTSIRQA